jgi:hypothetical protein
MLYWFDRELISDSHHGRIIPTTGSKCTNASNPFPRRGSTLSDQQRPHIAAAVADREPVGEERSRDGQRKACLVYVNTDTAEFFDVRMPLLPRTQSIVGWFTFIFIGAATADFVNEFGRRALARPSGARRCCFHPPALLRTPPAYLATDPKCRSAGRHFRARYTSTSLEKFDGIRRPAARRRAPPEIRRVLHSALLQ